ncbi:MAG: SCO family protein [Bacteroidetes bacterium]|nr:MAG: SCO family protein [Bacteroidota bacterium]
MNQMEKSKRSIWLITLIILITPFLAYALIRSYQTRFDKLPVFGQPKTNKNGITKPHLVDNFKLTNQDNEIFSSDQLNDKIVVFGFFFTSCPSVCPKMIKHIKNLQENLARDTHVAFISITVDPAHDDATRLKKYIEKNNIQTKNWSFLTGDKKEIYLLARKSFFLSTIEGDGGEDDFIHSEQLVLVDTRRQIRGYYKGTDEQEVSQLEKDIKKLENE